MTPQRIQRRRTPGWRMPVNTVYVGRPTQWGNPFAVGQESGLVRFGPKHLERFGRAWDHEGRCSADGARHDMWYSADDIVETYVRYGTRAELVELFRLTLAAPTPGMLAAYPSRRGRFYRPSIDEIRAELAGKNLACWCPLELPDGQRGPCHADVLLELANPEVVFPWSR